MKTLFISDLHLSQQTSCQTALFLQFLASEIVNADALYILGDLFETWIGDDDCSQFNQSIVNALHHASRTLPIYFMHGNRDFLLGETFAQKASLQLLTDPTRIELYGTPTLLLHGDSLCTDDMAYQKIRLKTRDPHFQQSLLKKPLFLRRLMAHYYRSKSRRYTQYAQLSIMDANQVEINRIMKYYDVKLLIHGHTHQPTLQYFQLEGRWVERIVLCDWHANGNVLSCFADGSKRLTYF